MRVGVTLGASALGLVLAFGTGAGIGKLVGPIDTGVTDNAPHDHASDEQMTDSAALEPVPAGLQVSQNGYTFAPEPLDLGTGSFAFTILGPDGSAVRNYDLVQERELHLVVVSRDLSVYAHLHPERDRDGRWVVDLPALESGVYRALADFEPQGDDEYVLGVDLFVPGTLSDTAPLEPRSLDTVDGFDVTVDDTTGTSEVVITVRRNGQPVEPEPYLGAGGHLVALREGDLAYLHAHPMAGDQDGTVRFGVDFPSSGTYALFFDFQVDGEVHTAHFVLRSHHH